MQNTVGKGEKERSELMGVVLVTGLPNVKRPCKRHAAHHQEPRVIEEAHQAGAIRSLLHRA